jgi:hypothetical protein
MHANRKAASLAELRRFVGAAHEVAAEMAEECECGQGQGTASGASAAAAGAAAAAGTAAGTTNNANNANNDDGKTNDESSGSGSGGGGGSGGGPGQQPVAAAVMARAELESIRALLSQNAKGVLDPGSLAAQIASASELFRYR